MYDDALWSLGRGKGGPSSCTSGRCETTTHACSSNWAATSAAIRSAICRRRNLLSAYLDRLDQENALPKTILYNVNPADNCVFATMIGNFQGGALLAKSNGAAAGGFSINGKACSGRLNTLSNQGLLSRFVAC